MGRLKALLLMIAAFIFETWLVFSLASTAFEGLIVTIYILISIVLCALMCKWANDVERLKYWEHWQRRT